MVFSILFKLFCKVLRIVDLYEAEELGEQGKGAGIRRTRKWRFDKILTHTPLCLACYTK